MLDYDGTLAPFRVERERALPPPRVMPLVRAIAESSRTRLALVTGRPLDQLEGLIGSLNASLVGEHGWEEQTSDHGRVRFPLPEGAEVDLARAAEAAAARGWEARLERKRASVVFHTRGMARDVAADLEATATQLWEHASERLRLVRIAGGLELRVIGRDKGTAVRGLTERSAHGTLPVYVGDDVTDEDAFGAVREWGLGIRVGSDERPTLARGRLVSCEAVADFLATWLRSVERRERIP